MMKKQIKKITANDCVNTFPEKKASTKNAYIGDVLMVKKIKDKDLQYFHQTRMTLAWREFITELRGLSNECPAINHIIDKYGIKFIDELTPEGKYCPINAITYPEKREQIK